MAEPGDWRGLFWRFYPASDPDVAVMVSRDTDSRLTARERAAVDEWLASDRDFHVMRDHPEHDVSILGGMWGVRNGPPRDMRALIDAQRHDDRWQVDQEFLDAVIAPRVRRAPAWSTMSIFARRPFPCARVDARMLVGGPFDALDRLLAERPRSRPGRRSACANACGDSPAARGDEAVSAHSGQKRGQAGFCGLAIAKSMVWALKSSLSPVFPRRGRRAGHGKG